MAKDIGEISRPPPLLYRDDTVEYDFLKHFTGGKTLQLPEKELFLAVLKDALTNFVEKKNKTLFEESREWIFSDDHEWPFSYINCCEVLDIDPWIFRRACKKLITNSREVATAGN